VSESSGFVHREPVRFRDLDGMGHVNNAVFSTYLEQARLAWFSQERFAAVDELPLGDVILARTEIDFRSPVQAGETVEVAVRPARVGTKSFELAYELRAAGRLVAEAKSVLVGYDYRRGESTPIPDRWKRRLSE
jgi:acyl-CoA thioester hydrolase